MQDKTVVIIPGREGSSLIFQASLLFWSHWLQTLAAVLLKKELSSFQGCLWGLQKYAHLLIMGNLMEMGGVNILNLSPYLLTKW